MKTRMSAASAAKMHKIRDRAMPTKSYPCESGGSINQS
jgi:hypothetical protein